jgi:hypothetical protein
VRNAIDHEQQQPENAENADQGNELHPEGVAEAVIFGDA